MVIYWPSLLDNGQNLLYLPTMPQVIRGQGTCTTETINPNNLTVTAVSDQLVSVICVFVFYVVTICNLHERLLKSLINQPISFYFAP